MATGTAGTDARRYHTAQVHYLRKNIVFGDEGTEITVGEIPANSIIVGGGVHVVTAFDDSSTLDVGFKDGSSTDDPNAYATALDVTGIGFIALDVLSATANIMQTQDHKVTATLNDGSGAVSAGSAEVVVTYVVDNDG